MSKFNFLLFAAIISTTLFISNCKHDPNPIPVTPVDTVKKDTTKTVTDTTNSGNFVKDSVCFSEEILPILLSNCANSGCHDDTTRQSGIILTSYSNVTSSISGNLLVQIITDSGPLRMPPASQNGLTTQQIDVIKKWVNEGMKNNIDCVGPCDTASVTYAGTIAPIIQNSCLGCHNNGTSPNLSGYSNVKAQVDNGLLICTTTRANGCSPMPKNGPKLSECKLIQIKKWVREGAQNN